MSRHQNMLPVWFFIGILLLAYGIIILATAIQQWSHPSAVVLAGDHPDFWGGLVLLLIGGIYTFRFRPKRSGRP